ncbi:peptide chain release factor N(5)-glutamine methyltransferase [Sulfuricystis multivorans]|uniref:peptide chain release factor N(5)-glutamine methyltransferase n=1 Tax=Sulfuricystis multivorans TaxID=2211108 RepID=UPI000F82B743|nr:peptide chain release factor N(5)-glutamine methyltransferase [Sulfuricystis multivorans]
MRTVAALLAAARKILPAGEARVLLAHVLDRNTAWLEAHCDEPLAEHAALRFQTLVERRAAGEPTAYLIGRREFYGRDFIVTPEVLIPRPETELLVDLALETLGGKVGSGGTARILDLGTGSGCLAITLALELPGVQVSAVDVSAAALAVARRNAARLDAEVGFFESDWFASLPPQSFDLIVANPPYVAASDPHLTQGDLRFEPVVALTDHADGLSAIRRVVAEAPRWLAEGGGLFFEHGWDQGDAARDLLSAAGFEAIEQRQDLAGIVRVSGGRKPQSVVSVPLVSAVNNQ